MGVYRAPPPPTLQEIQDAYRDKYLKKPVPGQVIRYGHKDGKLVVTKSLPKPLNIEKKKSHWWWPFSWFNY